MHPQHGDVQTAEESAANDKPVPKENRGNDAQIAEGSAASHRRPALTQNRRNDHDDDFEGAAGAIFTTFGKGMIEAVVSYALPMMNTYLTDVWQLNFTKAAGIVNVWQGVSTMLPVALAYLSDTVLGVASVYVITNIAYTIGLGFLSMSTPPVLANVAGTCSDYKSECIGETQRNLFFTSLAFIAVGIAGYIFIIGILLAKIQPKQTQTDDQVIITCFKATFRSIILITYVIMGIIYSAIKPWSLRFGIPAISSALSTFCSMPYTACFLFAVNDENKHRLSPITTVIRVVVASACKVSEKLPDDPAQLYEKNETNIQSLPHTRGLRFLDKAAIISPNKSLEEQEKHKWRLCTVTQVEETKIAIRMFPMWMTFIVCGVITSIGNTYFLEQAKHLNQKIGNLTLPFLFLPVFHKLMKSLIGTIRKRFTPQVGIALAMTCSVLCCIIAALVERRRLRIVIRHALLDKPDERTPMSVLWLVPQFIFLAGLDSLLEKCVENLFIDQIPLSSIRYLTFFTRGVSGAGIAGGALSVYIVGNVSERGGRMNWFQGTLNKSRLDKYYWTLAALGAVNFILYNLVVIFFPFRKPKQEEDPDGIGSVQKYLEDCKCCGF